MTVKSVLAAAALLSVGACATPKMPEISPLQVTTHEVTPETAQTLAARGLYPQAILAYRVALKANPEDAPSRYGLAEALRKSGKADDAKAEFTALLEKPEWKSRALEGLGRVAMAAGNRNGAFDLLNQAVAEDANAWGAWMGIALIHDLNRDWVKADEAYALALAAADKPAVVLNNHGVSTLARGDSAAAAELFRSALAADPKMERARVNLELAEAVKGKSIQAVSASEQDSRERARVLNNFGYVAMLEDRPEEARAFYQAAMKEHPSFYPKAYQNMKALDAEGTKEETPSTPSSLSINPKG